MGLPVAKYVKERGYDTYGYDISPKAMEMAQATATIVKLLILMINLTILAAGISLIQAGAFNGVYPT